MISAEARSAAAFIATSFSLLGKGLCAITGCAAALRLASSWIGLAASIVPCCCARAASAKVMDNATVTATGMDRQ